MRRGNAMRIRYANTGDDMAASHRHTGMAGGSVGVAIVIALNVFFVFREGLDPVLLVVFVPSGLLCVFLAMRWLRRSTDHRAREALSREEFKHLLGPHELEL